MYYQIKELTYEGRVVDPTVYPDYEPGYQPFEFCKFRTPEEAFNELALHSSDLKTPIRDGRLIIVSIIEMDDVNKAMEDKE